MSNKLHVLGTLPLTKNPRNHWIRGWVGLKDGLDILETSKISYPCQNSNPEACKAVPILPMLIQHLIIFSITSNIIFNNNPFIQNRIIIAVQGDRIQFKPQWSRVANICLWRICCNINRIIYTSIMCPYCAQVTVASVCRGKLLQNKIHLYCSTRCHIELPLCR